MTPPCELIVSDIVHIRHSGEHHPASHMLKKSGLSICIDLDNLSRADCQTIFFSVDKFNLLGFHQRDHGPNFGNSAPLVPLSRYLRQIATKLIPEQEIASAHLITFPRILGSGFNPLSVYVARNFAGNDILYIYEVRNTFGDMHSYIGTPTGKNTILKADKIFHVSPFFPLEGEYHLRLRMDNRSVNLLMRYLINGKPALTATLRGTRRKLTSRNILSALISTLQFPSRPLISIHFEALKLLFKKVPFYKRTTPPNNWSRAKKLDKAN